MAAHNDLGKRGEDLAEEFFQAKGYQVLDRNYRFEKGEIDLVALRLDPAELVFVEVKTRSDDTWGHPEEAVTDAKRKLIFRVAECYLYEKHLQTVPVRFDVLSINLRMPEHPLFEHFEDAFRMW